MIVFEKARELGELIRTTEQAVNKESAMEAYVNDKEAVSKMEEYEAYQRRIQEMMQNGSLSKEEFNEATERLKSMGTDLKRHSVIGPYIEASNNFNRMINQVFGIIQKTALGDTGDCNCGGGCESGDCEEGTECGEKGEACACDHRHGN